MLTIKSVNHVNPLFSKMGRLFKRQNIAQSTHPVITSFDHPLFACGGKRGFEKVMLFCHPEERRIYS